jgi:hypothetical protein
MSTLPITSCPDGAGTLNNTSDPSLKPLPNYAPPDLCVGTFDLVACQDTFQEQLAAENLNISGAPLNVFKLLGVHEQGKLIDLVGAGAAINASSAAFDELAPNWSSPQIGMQVLKSPSWIGYDFGTIKTSYLQEQNAPGSPNAQHITSIRIAQPNTGQRALQIRVERSIGGYKLDPLKVKFTGSGNGSISGFTPGAGALPGNFMLVADTPTSFTVFFTSATTVVVGICTVGVRFNSMFGSFIIQPGTVPFITGDMFSLPIELDWFRVDVVNLPDTPSPALIRIKQSSASRYWRIVPTSFSGVLSNSSWEVQRLELFDFQATRLDDIQDELFLENRDRDYAKQSVQFKVAYQPFDAVSDLSKFGFQVSDIYTFTTVFSTMVRSLGRPIVVGDVLEVPSEMQYDHNLRPVRKFLEVTETGWSADGYTTSWRPITFKFQAQQLIPSQETRDIFGTIDTQKYSIDDSDFFKGVQQIQTGMLTATEAVNAEAALAVPEKGTNIREQASGTNRYNAPGSYDGVGLYVEDGLPPDGLSYTEGFKLIDVGKATEGEYFRLNYDPALNISARLYRFSKVKNAWIFVEKDRRAERSSFKPSQLEIFNQPTVMSLTTKKIL